MINSEQLSFVASAKILQPYQIMFIKDLPQANEAEQEQGFSSQTARMEFETLARHGMSRNKVYPSYVFNFRPPDGELSALFWRRGIDTEGYIPWGDEKNTFILEYAHHELKRLREEIQRTGAKFIIAAGKWALYFLTGQTTHKDTAQSSYGALLKWRASHLELSPWWNCPGVLVIPSLPLNCKYELPDKQFIIDIDLRRFARIAKVLEDTPAEFPALLHRKESFNIPPDRTDNLTILQDKDDFHKTLWRVLHNLLSYAEQDELYLAIDVETQSYAFIDCIGIAWSEADALCIPFSSKESAHYWSEHQELELFTLLYALLTHNNVKHIGQNYQYDMQYLWRNMLLRVQPELDTMVISHSIFSVMDKNLGFLSSLHCNVHRWWKDSGDTRKGASNVDRWVYNMRDCCSTYEIGMKLKGINYPGWAKLPSVIHNQMKNVLPTIINVMERGVNINTGLRDRHIMELEHEASKIAARFLEALQEPVNLHSSPQMKTLFYELFSCPKQWKKVTDDHGISRNTLALDEESLKIIWESEILVRPFIDMLLDYKRLTKTAGGLKALSLDTDGKLRCSYNVCGTDTYRFSSNSNAFGTGTNLQVISKGKKLRNGKALPNSKELFLPSKGCTFFDIDLDSADLRIVTAESGAKDLAQMFREGQKPYIMLMREFYHDPTKNKNSAEYGIFKALCHGSNYKGSAAGLAARVGLLVKDVDRIQKWYFGRNPEIARWHTELEKQVRKRQWIENSFGYRRYFFDLREKTLMQVATAWIPQSSVAILINTGMVRIDREEPNVQVLLQTHDSLAGEFPTAIPEMKQRIIDLCSNPVPYDTPFIIPVDIQTSEKNWGDCH